MDKRRFIQAGFTAGFAGMTPGWFAQRALAQVAGGFPNKPVRMVVPYTTGQSADIFGRMVSLELAKVWKQQVFVDNKGGGASIPGMVAGRNAPPDGYTVTVGGSGPLGINPGLYGAKLPYNPVTDFIPVHGLFLSPLVVLANPRSGIDTFGQLVAKAKANPGNEKWGVAGLGTSPHLAAELIRVKTNTSITAVPYRGSGPMMNDLLGGQVMLGVDTISAAIPFVKSGQLKALAVTSAKRLPQLPDVPTIAEIVQSSFEAVGWAGFLLPAGTPVPIVAQMEKDIHQVMSDPALQDSMTQRGALPDLRGSAEFGTFLKAEVTKWTELIVANNIKVDS